MGAQQSSQCADLLQCHHPTRQEGGWGGCCDGPTRLQLPPGLADRPTAFDSTREDPGEGVGSGEGGFDAWDATNEDVETRRRSHRLAQEGVHDHGRREESHHVRVWTEGAEMLTLSNVVFASRSIQKRADGTSQSSFERLQSKWVVTGAHHPT